MRISAGFAIRRDARNAPVRLDLDAAGRFAASVRDDLERISEAAPMYTAVSRLHLFLPGLEGSPTDGDLIGYWNRALLYPLARLFGWTLGESSEVVTERDVEDARMPLPADSKTIPCVVANPAESMLDLPPEGLHRRFAPSHSLARILEHEGLTWGLLLNAFGLRLVRFVESAWLRIAPGNNRRVSAVGADCLVAIP